MGKYVASEIVKLMIRKGLKIMHAKVLQLGITFKENCPDCRNSRAVDVVRGLREFGCDVDIFDPWAPPEDIRREYGLESFRDPEELAGKNYDAVVLAVSHRQFSGMDLRGMCKDSSVIYDIKSVLPPGVADARL